MNIGLMILSAVIATVGLILITEYAGRRKARYFKQFLTFLAVGPFIYILVGVMLVMVFDPDSTEAASLAAADNIMSQMPTSLVSAYVGEAVGVFLWGIYRFLKCL